MVRPALHLHCVELCHPSALLPPLHALLLVGTSSASCALWLQCIAELCVCIALDSVTRLLPLVHPEIHCIALYCHMTYSALWLALHCTVLTCVTPLLMPALQYYILRSIPVHYGCIALGSVGLCDPSPAYTTFITLHYIATLPQCLQYMTHSALWFELHCIEQCWPV